MQPEDGRKRDENGCAVTWAGHSVTGALRFAPLSFIWRCSVLSGKIPTSSEVPAEIKGKWYPTWCFRPSLNWFPFFRLPLAR